MFEVKMFGVFTLDSHSSGFVLKMLCVPRKKEVALNTAIFFYFNINNIWFVVSNSYATKTFGYLTRSCLFADVSKFVGYYIFAPNVPAAKVRLVSSSKRLPGQQEREATTPRCLAQHQQKCKWPPLEGRVECDAVLRGCAPPGTLRATIPESPQFAARTARAVSTAKV